MLREKIVFAIRFVIRRTRFVVDDFISTRHSVNNLIISSLKFKRSYSISKDLKDT
jgi:hypothetical protein